MSVPRTYNELFERPYHLQLERESADFWIVIDRWNPDTVMMRSADRALCARFVRAFAEKEGATYDALSLEYSWRVAQESMLSEREVMPIASQDGTGSSLGLAPRSENVLPFRPRMHEPLDESA